MASGTAALALICAALDLGPGDEVILPSLTFAATAATVVHAGATPVFAEIRSEHRPWLSADGHSFALLGSAKWAEDVFAFLDDYCGR